MGDNLRDRAKNLMNQYWNIKQQFGMSFGTPEDEEDTEVDLSNKFYSDYPPPVPFDLDEEEEEKIHNNKNKLPDLFKVERGDDPRDVVSEEEKDVRLDEGPAVRSKKRLSPTHGITLSDLLTHVANKLETSSPHIAKVLSNVSILDQIKKIFATNKLSLISYDDPFITIGDDDVVYYWKDVDNGIKIWINKSDLSINSALTDVCKELTDMGYVVSRQGNGIIVSNGKVDLHSHNSADVASQLGGSIWESKNKEKARKGWHSVVVDGIKISYTLFPAGTVTVCCSGLYGTIESKHDVNLLNKRHLLNILKYQKDRYVQMFEPSTYGLTQESKPFKLKKHVLIPCTNNCVLVLSPSDNAILLHQKGEYSLCHNDGRLGLNIGKTFKKVDHTNEALYKEGDTYNGFAPLLKKRGYLQ